MAWSVRPDIVSLGTQKCFDRFMADLGEAETTGNPLIPDSAFFKALVAKAIVCKAVHKTARPLVTAFLANVAVYTVAVVARSYGDSFNLDKVWLRQDVTPQFLEQVKIWAREVNDRLHETANGKMISEWAKRPECKEAIFSRPFSPPSIDVPEARLG